MHGVKNFLTGHVDLHPHLGGKCIGALVQLVVVNIAVGKVHQHDHGKHPLQDALAPTPAIGDSVANILEEMGLETCGCCGTTACLALLNDAVKKGGVMASNHVGGLSGAFIPVSEDAGMIHAAEIGCLTIEKLEAMTAVCSVGIDMVIIPGDTTPAVISALIADEAAIGMVNSKTTAVRVIPAIGRKAGEVLDFGGLLGYGPIMPVNSHDPSVFINRGGRLPAPMQSLKN